MPFGKVCEVLGLVKTTETRSLERRILRFLNESIGICGLRILSSLCGNLSSIHLKLSEVTHAGCENWLDFGSGNVFRYAVGITLGVGHFSEHAAARRGDALDGVERAVRVERMLHGGVAIGVAVLGGDLAVGGELRDNVLRGVEFTFAVRNGNGVDRSDFLVGKPR